MIFFKLNFFYNLNKCSKITVIFRKVVITHFKKIMIKNKITLIKLIYSIKSQFQINLQVFKKLCPNNINYNYKIGKC